MSLPHTDSLWLLYADTGGPGSLYTLPDFSRRWNFRQTPLQKIIESVAFPMRETLVRELVQHGYDIDETWLRSDRQGGALNSCCHRLYQDGQMFGGNGDVRRTVLLLLKLGANPNLPRQAPRSNIYRVLSNEEWGVYDAFLSNSLFDADAPDERGKATIHHLVTCAPSRKILELTESRKIMLNAQDKSGSTALHLAVTYRKLEAVKTLLRIPGVRVDLIDVQGRTPLALAAYWDHRQIAFALIERSDAVPIPDREYLSPLVFAAKHGDRDLCVRLLESSQYQKLKFQVDHSGKGILHHLAANDWSDLLDCCLKKGDANVNHIDHSGGSALHMAATLGNTVSCQVLLRHGASLQLQDRIGRTAPQAAADAGFKDTLMALLRSRRVDPNQRDFEGRNLVHWAATIDCVEIISFLAEIPGVDIAQKDKHGKTPIDIAFICKCPTVGRFLVEKMRTRKSPTMFFDIYDWDSMYNSPIVLWSEDKDDRALFSGELQERESRRQKASVEEWEAIRRQYPPEQWALVSFTAPQDTDRTRAEDESEKARRKERVRDARAGRGTRHTERYEDRHAQADPGLSQQESSYNPAAQASSRYDRSPSGSSYSQAQYPYPNANPHAQASSAPSQQENGYNPAATSSTYDRSPSGSSYSQNQYAYPNASPYFQAGPGPSQQESGYHPATPSTYDRSPPPDFYSPNQYTYPSANRPPPPQYPTTMPYRGHPSSSGYDAPPVPPTYPPYSHGQQQQRSPPPTGYYNTQDAPPSRYPQNQPGRQPPDPSSSYYRY